MADLSDDNSQNRSSSDDFIDPLGANDPLGSGSDGNAYEFNIDLSPCRQDIDLDQAIADHCQSLPKMTAEEDLENETRDLFVNVDNPEKHMTTMESYITFRVITKTSRPEYDSAEYVVRRRYNDFLWLRQRLEETQPTHLVSPLPEKHSLKRLDRFSQEFVKTRMGALQTFLHRIAEHPVLSFNKYFQTFLTAKQSEFQAAKKEGSGFISRMADSFHNISASYMMKTRAPEFTEMNDYINTFSEKLGVLERISQRVVREQTDLAADFNEWGPIFTLWSNSEENLSGGLSAMAKSIEKCYLALQQLMDTTESQFNQPLKEYMLYTDAIKAVLRRRDAIQMEYEMTLEEMNRKKEEREQVVTSEQSYSLKSFLGQNPEDLKMQKLEKLDLHMDELSRQVEVLNDKATCANADLKADMDRWHKTKRRDFRKLFMNMADRQIKYYEVCLDAWEEAIPQIQRTNTHAEPEVVQDTGKDCDD